MNIKESDLIAKNGWLKSDLKAIRHDTIEFEGMRLWFREESKKPKHLQTIWWTDVGVMYLTEYFNVVKDMKKFPDESESRVMSKEEFAVSVNNSKWIGRVISNNYKNFNTIMVEHDTGFRVMVNCRNNKVLPKNSYVEVDTKNNRHTIRKPAFKTYEKAKQA
jgi:hypothetical protein